MNSDYAIIWGTRKIAWSQMDVYCANASGQLKTIGLKAGDRVAICAPTSPEYIIVVLSLWRMGVVVCPVNPKLPAQSISAYLSQIHAVLFLTSAQIKSTHHGIPQRTLILNEIVNFDARHGFNYEIKAWQPYEAQEVTVIATSGSSGQPKAVVHTWGNHYYNALGSQDVIPLTATDRWLLCLPLFHVAGIAIVVRAMIAKAAIVIPVEDDLFETIIKRSVTHASLVATQVFRLMSNEQGVQALKSLKYLLIGGSAISVNLIEQAQALQLNAFTSYGLTEMSSQVATGKIGQGAKVLKYRDLKIGDNNAILVKGTTLFKGYIQAGRVNLPTNTDGYFDTGDQGVLNDGILTVLGRRDNMFISGGENIHPEEIEKVLLSIKGITQAMVVPKEDREYGQRPVAFLDYAKDANIRVDEIVRLLQEHLPSFKIPGTFFPWPVDLIEKGIKISRKDLQRKVNPVSPRT